MEIKTGKEIFTDIRKASQGCNNRLEAKLCLEEWLNINNLKDWLGIQKDTPELMELWNRINL